MLLHVWCRAGMVPRAGGNGGGGPQPGQFGHPSRRVTDVLLVGNAVLFALQLASKEVLTLWGVKVGACGWVGGWVGGPAAGEAQPAWCQHVFRPDTAARPSNAAACAAAPTPPCPICSPACSAPLQVNALILAGQYWRLLTPAFLHGSITHLAVNCFSLNNLGPTVEATAG
jgi:hypothetical protein